MAGLAELVVSMQGGLPGELPGPAPWGARQWLGAAAYVAAFLLALQGLRVLARDAPAEEESAR